MTADVRSPVDPARVLDAAIAALNNPGARMPLEDVARALELAPNDPRLWHVKGLIHRQLEQRELAVPALLRAAELAPQEPLIALGYARTSFEAGLPSVDAFARAMKLNPSKPEVVRGLVSALLAERRVDDAISGLELSLSRSPTWAEGHSLLARLRWIEGERVGFARSFEHALAQYPKSVELWSDWLEALLQAEQLDEVLHRVEQGRAALGDLPMFALNEAIAHAELGHTDVADRLFDPFVDTPAGPIQVRRVRHLLRSGRADQATALIEQWLHTPEGFMFWPYASIAWRMTDQARWEWLEADDRFVGVF